MLSQMISVLALRGIISSWRAGYRSTVSEYLYPERAISTADLGAYLDARAHAPVVRQGKSFLVGRARVSRIAGAICIRPAIERIAWMLIPTCYVIGRITGLAGPILAIGAFWFLWQWLQASHDVDTVVDQITRDLVPSRKRRRS